MCVCASRDAQRAKERARAATRRANETDARRAARVAERQLARSERTGEEKGAENEAARVGMQARRARRDPAPQVPSPDPVASKRKRRDSDDVKVRADPPRSVL